MRKTSEERGEVERERGIDGESKRGETVGDKKGGGLVGVARSPVSCLPSETVGN